MYGYAAKVSATSDLSHERVDLLPSRKGMGVVVILDRNGGHNSSYASHDGSDGSAES